MNALETDPVDQNGRVLGPKAQQTRQRLMEATQELLRRRSLREIRVVEIARKVGTSPATFYQYFRDVEEVVLRLAEQAADEMPAVVELIEGSWDGEQGMERARSIVDAFIRHWDAHHAVLRVRNLASDEGDLRFQRVRRRTFIPVIDGFAEKISASQRQGRVHDDLHPHAAAAALAAILERLAAYHRELEGIAARDELVDTCARILVQTVTGRA